MITCPFKVGKRSLTEFQLFGLKVVTLRVSSGLALGFMGPGGGRSCLLSSESYITGSCIPEEDPLKGDKELVPCKELAVSIKLSLCCMLLPENEPPERAALN